MEQLENLKRDLNQLETVSEEEIRGYQQIVEKAFYDDRINLDKKRDLKEAFNSILSLNKKFKTLESLLANKEYVRALGLLYELKNKHESIINSITNSSSSIEELNKFISIEEEKLSKMENILTEDIIKQIEDEAYKQAKKTIREDRLKIVFNTQAINNFHKHIYKEQYKDPMRECAGYFSYEYNSNQLKLADYHPIQEYEERSKEHLILAEEKKEELKRKNIISAHSHPPGAQKCHSRVDWGLVERTDKVKGTKIVILGVPESTKQIWTVAQSPKKEGKEWCNHQITVEPEPVPRAHLKKYNKAIEKALAASECIKEFSKWENVHLGKDEEGPLIGKMNIDKNLYNHMKQNNTGENQWIQFLKSETY